MWLKEWRGFLLARLILLPHLNPCTPPISLPLSAPIDQSIQYQVWAPRSSATFQAHFYLSPQCLHLLPRFDFPEILNSDQLDFPPFLNSYCPRWSDLRSTLLYLPLLGWGCRIARSGLSSLSRSGAATQVAPLCSILLAAYSFLLRQADRWGQTSGHALEGISFWIYTLSLSFLNLEVCLARLGEMGVRCKSWRLVQRMMVDTVMKLF